MRTSSSISGVPQPSYLNFPSSVKIERCDTETMRIIINKCMARMTSKNRRSFCNYHSPIIRDSIATINGHFSLREKVKRWQKTTRDMDYDNYLRNNFYIVPFSVWKSRVHLYYSTLFPRCGSICNYERCVTSIYNLISKICQKKIMGFIKNYGRS